MLELAGIHAGYENRDVLHGLSFAVPPGAIVAVVGVNGAGKSTTLKVISGLLKARKGSYDGRGNFRGIVKASIRGIKTRASVDTPSPARDTRMRGGGADRVRST